MGALSVEILFILLLILVNGALALSEIAVVSARKARVQQWAESGNRKARLALEIARAPGEFLSTVQVGITLVGIFAGAFGGATLARHLATAIAATPALAVHAETIAVVLVVVAITYFSLVLGELVPKRIALIHAERIALHVAAPMRMLSRLASPAVWLLSKSTNGLLWLLRIRPLPEPPVTEDEIRILVRQGAEAGSIARSEREILDRVFRLDAQSPKTVMTPRRDLAVLFTADSPEQVRRKVEESGHAVYPVSEGSLDNVVGVVRAQDLLAQLLRGERLDVQRALRQPLVIPDSVSSLHLLEAFRKTDADAALILDEHGGFEGLVTPSDLLRTLLGELSALSAPRAVQQPDGSWLIDGMLPIDEFREALGLGAAPIEAGLSPDTVGGLVTALIGRLPSEGDEVDWDRYHYRIIDMDGLRVDKILATPIAGTADAGGPRKAAPSGR